MKPHAWTLWVTMVLVGTAGAWLVSRGLAEETHEVEVKDKEVIKNFDIDKNDEEPVAPESVESLDEGKIKITTKTFTPPTGWTFTEFDADYTPVTPYDRRPFNPGSYVDIEIDPECLPPLVEAPTVTVPKDGVDAIKVVVTELTVPPTAGNFPLKCEGNLQPPPGGQGTAAFHWSAKIPGVKIEFVRTNGDPIETVGDLETDDPPIEPVPLEVLKQMAEYRDTPPAEDDEEVPNYFPEMVHAFHTQADFGSVPSDTVVDTVTVTITDKETGSETEEELTETAVDSLYFVGTDLEMWCGPMDSLTSGMDSIDVAVLDKVGDEAAFQELTETGGSTLVFESKRCQVSLTFSDDLDPSSADTIDAEVVDDGLLTGETVELTETAADSQVFESGDGSITVALDSIGSFDPGAEDSFAIRVTADNLSLTNAPLTVRETGADTLVFLSATPLIEDGYDDSGGTEPPPDPEIPELAKFKLRITDPVEECDTITCTLVAYDEDGGVHDSHEVDLTRTEGSVFESDKILVGYTGDEEAPSEVVAHFEADYILVWSSTYEATYKSTNKQTFTLQVHLCYRTKPKDEPWSACQDTTSLGTDARGDLNFPALVEYDTKVEVYAVIRYYNKDTRREVYYLGSTNDTGFPTSVKIGGQVKSIANGKLKRLAPAQAGRFAFSWKRVHAKYGNYRADPGKVPKLKYVQDVEFSNSAWKVDVGGKAPTSGLVGQHRYMVTVTYGGKSFNSWDNKTLYTRHKRNGDDKCISNKVLRICVKGNYTAGNKGFLNTAASFIDSPWIWSAWTNHHGKRRIGFDCAEMVGQAYREWAGQLPSHKGEPSSVWLVEWARTTTKLTFIRGDYTRNIHIRTKDILEGGATPLQPGDIIVFYYMRGGKPNWYHSAVIVSLDGSGKLSNDDVILMVNSSHRQSGETGDARKHYRTRLMKLEGLLREDTGPGWNYEYATVLRASK